MTLNQATAVLDALASRELAFDDVNLAKAVHAMVVLRKAVNKGDNNG